MYNIILKFFIVLLLIIIAINILPNFSYGDDWIGYGDNFLNSAEKSIGLDKVKLKSASDDIYNIFSSVGMIISVIVGIGLGIIYMMSSAIDKAKVKETLIPYIIGSFIIFGAFGIWKVAINTLGGL